MGVIESKIVSYTQRIVRFLVPQEPKEKKFNPQKFPKKFVRLERNSTTLRLLKSAFILIAVLIDAP